MELHLPKPVTEVLDCLKQAGEQGYLVGGCVRDLLLGRPVHDYDIAVSCPPERTAELFGRYPLVETGRRHGTIGVVTQAGVLELTTFRADGRYRDHRRPDEVRFLPDVTEDLARRDFTINAIALGLDGTLIDPFDGQGDLAQKTIRCVGEPRQRFAEDALRILRCARFAARLGFTVEPSTRIAALEGAESTRAISRERVTVEVLGFLAGERFSQAVGGCLPLFSGVWPEAKRLASHELARLALPLQAEAPILVDARLLALAACFYRVKMGGLPQSIQEGQQAMEQFLAVLRLPRKQSSLLGQGMELLVLPPAASHAEVCRRLPCYSAPAVDRARLAAELLGQDREAEWQWWRQAPCRDRSGLAISGRELLKLGVPAGPEVGRLLATLRNAVNSGQLPNNPECLLEQAMEWRKTEP